MIVEMLVIGGTAAVFMLVLAVAVVRDRTVTRAERARGPEIIGRFTYGPADGRSSSRPTAPRRPGGGS